MKEVIEYILAFLVILSVLPIYNYVMTNLYTPPQLEVEESVLATFSDQVVNLLEEQAIYGNLTSPLIDLKTLIENKFPYITKDYMFNIKIVSAGIQKTIVKGNCLKVYTIYKGNVSAFVLYEDHTYYSASTTKPSQILDNGTYIYTVFLNKAIKVVFAMIILDTGTYRFINYYHDQNIKKVYIGNYNGKFAIITDQNLAYYNLPGDKQGVDLIIISYSNGKFHIQSNKVVFGDIEDIYNFNLTPVDKIPVVPPIIDYIYEFKYRVDYNNNHISYYAINDAVLSVNGINYKILNGVVLNYQSIDTIEYLYYIRVRKLFGIPISSEVIDKSTKLINQTYLRSDYSYIYAPIYNLPLSILEDANGNKYIGIWYPRELTIGYTPPSSLPTRSVTLIRRLGSVDYYITITLWRKTT